MRIIDATRRSAVAVTADRPINQVAQLMEDATVGAVVVVDGDQPVGIVTDRDLVRRALARGLDGAARVDGVMSAPIVTIGADEDLRRAYQAFSANEVRRLVIVDDGGRFVGILSVDDLVMDLAADLAAIAGPISAEVLFGHHEVPLPATIP